MNMHRLISLTTVLLLLTGGCTKAPSPAQQQAKEQHDHPSQQVEEIYTCPMHPSVVSDRPGACPICHMALVKKTVQKDLDPNDIAGLKELSLSPTQQVMANVSTGTVQRSELSNDIQAVGIVSYAEPNYKRISARFPGRLEKLYVSYTGQGVRPGDPVANVYSPEAISAQQEYLLALDSYEQAKNTGRTLAIPAEQFLDQAREKLVQWGFTRNQIQTLTSTRKVNYVVTIYSPVGGTVVKKSVDLQQYVSTGEDMFDVADLSTVWVYLDVYEKDIRFVARGQQAHITAEAYPAEMFKGKVVFIDPVVNPETRTIRVRTEFPNAQMKLKPNMYVNATIEVPKTNALVIPSTAIISTGKRSVVWIQVRENTFTPRDVKVGGTSDGRSVILEGLEEGDTVVKTGGFLIDSESQLTAMQSVHKHD